MRKTTNYYVYFAESSLNKKIYTGFTSKDPKQRVREHNTGSNKFTRNNGPFTLIYYEKYICKLDALNREKFYKIGFGKQIRNLVVKYIKSGVRSSVGRAVAF